MIEWTQLAAFEKEHVKESKSLFPQPRWGEGLRKLFNSKSVELGLATPEELKTLAANWEAFENTPSS